MLFQIEATRLNKKQRDDHEDDHRKQGIAAQHVTLGSK